MKKFYVVALMLLTAGCANNDINEDFAVMRCPKVSVRQSDQAMIQTAGGQDLFAIEIVGYKGRCYYDEQILKDKAVVAPEFKITRLSESHVEDIHFSYYMETYEGPEKFLGRKTYFAKAEMLRQVPEIYYTPEQKELTIPAGKYDFDMYIGLNVIKNDSEYRIK